MFVYYIETNNSSIQETAKKQQNQNENGKI